MSKIGVRAVLCTALLWRWRRWQRGPRPSRSWRRPRTSTTSCGFPGFLWRAKPNGTFDIEGIVGAPGVGSGLDVSETLGFSDPSNGWIFEGNIAPARKHRFIFEFSKTTNTAERTIDLLGLGVPIEELTLEVATEISLREFHLYYNYLFVASPQVEFGLVGGLGFFNTRAEITTNLGPVGGRLRQPFPTFGTILLANPRGPVRGYFELTGFPKVTVDDLSGWQLDLHARIEVIIFDTVGVMLGYRSYRLEFQ